MKETYKIEYLPISQVHLSDKNPHLINFRGYHRCIQVNVIV
jgi:hypothetical protein